MALPFDFWQKVRESTHIFRQGIFFGEDGEAHPGLVIPVSINSTTTLKVVGIDSHFIAVDRALASYHKEDIAAALESHPELLLANLDEDTIRLAAVGEVLGLWDIARPTLQA